MRDFLEDFGIILVVMIFVTLIITGIGWTVSYKESRLYNNHFGTNYTTADFFWTGATIKDYIQQGEQKTHNIKL